MNEKKTLFIFIDGLGLGINDNETNPIVKYGLLSIERYFGTLTIDNISEPILRDGHLSVPLDTTHGVPGIPQSATGTATLLTGINCAKYMGRHCPAYPSKRLKALIRKENIFTKLSGLGFEVDFANAYRRPWFWQLWGVRASVTTISALSGIGWLRDIEMLKRGDAVYHDIDNSSLIERGYNVPFITPENAGENLLRIVRDSDFTLFEFFLTDIAGHSLDMIYASSVLLILNSFLITILDNLPKNMLFVLSSDHGNIEDITTKKHTTNPVPGLFIGDNEFLNEKKDKLKSIADITPMIIEYMTKPNKM
ncbi:MAG: metalloenzyme [bacterium]